mmetsp:Transcript_44168/g.79456  ORF Transcript_44168/g.79456 Transcript_44168/m.79456 type:complete len:266 (-) Transcript_44168:59-856(-)
MVPPPPPLPVGSAGGQAPSSLNEEQMAIYKRATEAVSFLAAATAETRDAANAVARTAIQELARLPEAVAAGLVEQFKLADQQVEARIVQQTQQMGGQMDLAMRVLQDCNQKLGNAEQVGHNLQELSQRIQQGPPDTFQIAERIEALCGEVNVLITAAREVVQANQAQMEQGQTPEQIQRIRQEAHNCSNRREQVAQVANNALQMARHCRVQLAQQSGNVPLPNMAVGGNMMGGCLETGNMMGSGVGCMPAMQGAPGGGGYGMGPC